MKTLHEFNSFNISPEERLAMQALLTAFPEMQFRPPSSEHPAVNDFGLTNSRLQYRMLPSDPWVVLSQSAFVDWTRPYYSRTVLDVESHIVR